MVNRKVIRGTGIVFFVLISGGGYGVILIPLASTLVTIWQKEISVYSHQMLI